MAAILALLKRGVLVVAVKTFLRVFIMSTSGFS
jgi:hypothetical protein